jgi:hypothetical protein
MLEHMNTELTPSPLPTQGVAAALRARGLSLRQFARRQGYVYRTVCITVQRWGQRSDRQPHGGLARRIMAELLAELSQ